jgi:hypothetical protein
VSVSGWPAVILLIVAQIALALWLIRLAARRWWDYLVIVILAAALVRPTARNITGDLSRYLPGAIWSGADDKDQIVFASAASTILLPLIVSTLAVYLFRLTRVAIGRIDSQDER